MSRHLAIQNALRIARQRFANGGAPTDQLSRWNQLQGSADAMLHGGDPKTLWPGVYDGTKPNPQLATSTNPIGATQPQQPAPPPYQAPQPATPAATPSESAFGSGPRDDNGSGGNDGSTGGAPGAPGNTFGSNTYGETYGPVNTGIGMLDNAMNNPGTAAINAGFGLVGGPLGIANSISGLVGGPTLGGMVTGSYSSPTAMSGTSYSKSSDPTAPAAPAAPAAPSAPAAPAPMAEDTIADAAPAVADAAPAAFGASIADGTIGGEAYGGGPFGGGAIGGSLGDGTIGGDTGSFGAGIGGISGTAANDGSIGGETGSFGAGTGSGFGGGFGDGSIGGETGSFGSGLGGDGGFGGGFGGGTNGDDSSGGNDSGGGFGGGGDNSGGDNGGGGSGGDSGGGDGGGGGGGGDGGGEKRGGYISMHHMIHRADGGIVNKALEAVGEGYARGGGMSAEDTELQRRMSQLLRPDHDDPVMLAKYLQARASYDMPTHERGAYSARVLPMAAHNVQTTIGPLGNAVPKQAQNMSWNAFHKLGKGGTLFTLGGDRSNLGRLTHINGKELAWPVDLHAGTKYMTEPNPGAVWANAKGARSALRKNILEAAKRGPVYGAFAAMGPTAVDSANNMFDVLMAQIPGSGISKNDAKAFDDSLKKGDHIKGSSEKDIQKREAVKEIMKNWPGIQNAEKARDFAKTLSGGHRGAIVKYMEAAPWQKSGFPSVGITRAAITDPELLDVSGNMMGHHVVELDPDTYDKRNLAFEHSTYGWPTGGKLVGKLPFIERHIATPDFTEGQVMDKAVVKKTGEPLIIHPYSPNDQGRSSYRGNTEMRQAIQPINNRMLESIQQEHGTTFADGGEVEQELARGGKTRIHPALNIPGVHIRTAEAGEPLFDGEK